MQNQLGLADQLAITSPIGGVVAGQLVEAADVLGVAYDTVPEGERAIIALRGAFGSTSVVTDETWLPGQRLFYNETVGVITSRSTHWPIGRADEGKADTESYGRFQLDRPDKTSGDVISSFEYSQLAPDFQADGDYVLRSFGQNVQVVMVEIVGASIAPGTATFAIGDGTGANDQILGATDGATLEGFNDLATLPNGQALPVTLNEMVLRIAGGPVTAGMLTIRAAYVAAA